MRNSAAALLLVSLAFFALSSRAGLAPVYREGEVLVRLRPGAQAAGFSAQGYAVRASALGGSTARLLLPPGKSVEAAVAELGSDPGVALVQPNYIYRSCATPADPLFASQYHHVTINAQAGWDITQGDSTILIAVLDTGADTNHPDLAAKLKFVSGSDISDSDSDPDDDSTTFAGGHGTAVAGTIGSIWNDTFGAGVDRYDSILPIRVLDITGSGTTDGISAGIDLARASGAKVINLSLGAEISTDPTMATAILNALNAGIVVVAAAGNSGSSTLLYPAVDENALGIGATDATDALASFSNRGSGLDVTAPGVSIVTLANKGNSQTISGTSLSTPIVAGAAGLAFAARPGASAEAVRSWIRAGTKDLGDAGWDPFYGFGRIDLAKILSLAAATPLYDTGAGVRIFDTFVSTALADTNKATTTAGGGPAGATVLSLSAADSFAGYAVTRFPSDSGTIEFFCYLSTAQGTSDSRILLTQKGNGTLTDSSIDLRLNSDTKLVLRQGSVGTITSSSALRMGEWNHIAVQYGTGGMLLWVNGESQGVVATARGLSSDTVFLGSPILGASEVPAFGRYGRFRAKGGHASVYPSPLKAFLTDVDDAAAGSALALAALSTGFTAQATTTGTLSVQWRIRSSDTRTATISIGLDADTSGFDGTILATGLTDDGEHALSVTSALSEGATKYVYIIADDGSETSAEYLAEGITRTAAAAPPGSVSLGGGTEAGNTCLLSRAGLSTRAGRAALRRLRDLLLATPLRILVALYHSF